LASKVGLGDLLVERGVLYTYPDESSLKAAQGMVAVRRKYGIAQEVLGARQVADLEPNLPACAGAVHHVGSIHLADTGDVTRRMAEAAIRQGVSVLPARVTGLAREASGVVLHAGDHRVLARRVIIAAGAHSSELARQAGDRVPLVAHRGYHVEFDMEESPVSRPVHRTQLGYYITPLRGRLRAAGTVEFASNEAAPSSRRFDQIERGVRATFPNMPPVARRWMGLRPAMPDSLPVIGASSGGADVIYAFGHGHVGLTLGPVTGQLVAALATGRPAPEVIRHFSPQRFGLFGKRAGAGTR
jgi:D-amino-acid dehydrogenase